MKLLPALLLILLVGCDVPLSEPRSVHVPNIGYESCCQEYDNGRSLCSLCYEKEDMEEWLEQEQ